MFWPVWTAAVGYLAEQVPARVFHADDIVTSTRSWERDGDWYRGRVAIHTWKGRLPEAGGAFGGFAKRSLGGRDAARLEQFAAETRRAEYAHWVMGSGVMVTCLWTPWWAMPVNVAVATGSNLPCIAVQRYNRARLGRLSKKWAATSAT